MKQLRFCLVFLLLPNLSFGQTREEVEKLGLTKTQLRTSLEKREIRLTDKLTRKKKKIKEGAFAVIRLKGDTAKLELILEAFLSDTIVVSSLSPKLVGKEIQLEFKEFRLIQLKDIATLEYSVRYPNGTYWTGFMMALIGLEAAVLPVVIPLITGETDEVYSQPQFPYFVVGGVVLYFLGRKVLKTLAPIEYNLETDWNFIVEKK